MCIRDCTGAYPDFARKLCDKNLPLDAKLDTAVNIVKKAYSEVPSFDSLLDALLNVPLQELHKACTLTPGIPVEPMLAKPTKSVLEVLKRLNGLRFTCEYKYDGERAQVGYSLWGCLFLRLSIYFSLLTMSVICFLGTDDTGW